MINFSTMVTKLKKPGSDIIKDLTVQSADMLHMAVGIVGEAFELTHATDSENEIEELGDLYFYIEGAFQIIDGWAVDGYKISTIPVPYDDESMMVDACSLLELVKKVAFYKKDPDFEGMVYHMSRIMSYVMRRAEEAGSSIEAVRMANVDKLWNKRYKDGYSNEAAQARADKA